MFGFDSGAEPRNDAEIGAAQRVAPEANETRHIAPAFAQRVAPQQLARRPPSIIKISRGPAA
jgi:hypothetical protein